MITNKSDAGFRPLMSGAIIALATLLPAQAAENTAGNLPADWHYPEPGCSKPTPPVSLSQTGNGPQMSQYQLTVENYNKRSSAYTQCVNRYLDNANEDIRRIQKQMDAVVAAANAP